MVKATYHFRLTKGGGTPVCDAYLERLNAAKYDIPPYCDIPEDDSISGFSKLKRVAISPDDAAELWPSIYMFETRQAEAPSVEASTPELREVISLGAAWAKNQFGVKVSAWRYDPPVSLNNDGKAHNLLIYRDSHYIDGFDGKCGWAGYERAPATGYRQAHIGYLLTPDSRKIDFAATRQLLPQPKRAGELAGAEPGRRIGYFFGIFEFQDVYYMETFFEQYGGDFEGKRVGAASLDNTLAVFLRRNRETRQICEYEMSQISAK